LSPSPYLYTLSLHDALPIYFVVDCIDAFSFLCLSSEERNGKYGQLLSAILLTLEGSALYRAVDRLHYGFAKVPGFARVALKAIQDRKSTRLNSSHVKISYAV